MLKKLTKVGAFVVPALLLVVAHAETVNISSALTTGFQTMVTDLIDTLVSIIPIALSILSVTWVAKKAIGFFKGTAK